MRNAIIGVNRKAKIAKKIAEERRAPVSDASPWKGRNEQASSGGEKLRWRGGERLPSHPLRRAFRGFHGLNRNLAGSPASEASGRKSPRAFSASFLALPTPARGGRGTGPGGAAPPRIALYPLWYQPTQTAARAAASCPPRAVS
ncbi:hypothetical protein SEVIR_5G128301v4 [Setaria viridis]